MFYVTVFSLLGLFLNVHGAGEFLILQSPEWIVFSGQEELDLSNLKNVLSTALGFSVSDGGRWSGLYLKDPFHFADAIAVVAVSGVESVDSSQGHTFPVLTDSPMQDVFDSLESRLTERYPAVFNLTALDFHLSDRKQIESKIEELTLRDAPATQYLDPSKIKDAAFLQEMRLFDAVTTNLCSRMCNDKKDKVVTDGIPDIYWFRVTGLEKLIELYGADSKQVEEAKKMLTSSILLLSEVFNTAYDYQVVFGVISSDTGHMLRYKRQAIESNSSGTTSGSTTGASGSTTGASGSTTGTSGSTSFSTTPPKGKQQGKDENFPAMFNIFLWFTVAMLFALFSICYCLATMDPGRDSIIYRMTSNRMKKDN